MSLTLKTMFHRKVKHLKRNKISSSGLPKTLMGPKPKPRLKGKKDAEEKKRQEEQAKIDEEKFNNLTTAEKKELRHEALNEVSHELKESKKKSKAKKFTESDLTDLEDQQSEAEEYEAAD